MKQREPFYIFIVLTLILTLSLAGCGLFSRNAPKQRIERMPVQDDPGASETWAMYWYLCGSDLESNWGLATADLTEMLAIALPEHVQVIIQTGGALRWHSGIDEESIGRYLYSGDRMELIESLPSVSMGDPDTLTDFLTFCNQNYPADRQVVVFWNHGGGSLWGAIFDERYEFSSLSLPELRRTLEQAPASSGMYEAIGFDACLMATVDVVDTLRGHARYMVASAEVEPGYGWDYTAIMDALALGIPDGGLLGAVICDSYYAACERAGEAYLATLSVIDLEKAGRLVGAYQRMGDEALLLGSQEPLPYLGAFGRAARKAQKYGPNSDNEGYVNMVDLGDLVRRAGDNLLPSSGGEVLTALEECVIYQRRGFLRGRSSGVACYFNYATSPEWSEAGLRSFAELGTNRSFAWLTAYSLTGAFDTEGEAYVKQLARAQGFGDFTVRHFSPHINRDMHDTPIARNSDGGFDLQLDPMDSASATGVGMRLEMEQNGAKIALGLSECEAADWGNGLFSGTCKTSWGAIDGKFVHMDPIEQADSYDLYAVPILLNGKKNILYVSFQQGAYRMLGAREMLDMGMVEKNLHPLAVGDVVEPLLPMFSGMDSNGNEIWDDKALQKVVIKKDTVFAEKKLDSKICRVSFVITGCSDCTYVSNPVPIFA